MKTYNIDDPWWSWEKREELRKYVHEFLENHAGRLNQKPFIFFLNYLYENHRPPTWQQVANAVDMPTADSARKATTRMFDRFESTPKGRELCREFKLHETRSRGFAGKRHRPKPGCNDQFGEKVGLMLGNATTAKLRTRLVGLKIGKD